ncbi:MAG: class I SAM-dependent methyltransferase, partial [Myxococcota bacterium]
LAVLAARNCLEFPLVKIEQQRLEDWQVRERSFDLVLFAQSFHWMDREQAFAKAAAALVRSGWLALFWNNPLPVESRLFEEIQHAYEKYTPGLGRYTAEVLESRIEARRRHVEGSELFGPVELRRYAWEARYSAADYVRLLETHSDHMALPEATRERLFAGIVEAIERAGGTFVKPHVAVLYLAPRA